MGKQGAAARRLPHQGFVEQRQIDRQQHQIGLTGVVAARGLGQLIGRRHMDVAVGQIDDGALVATFRHHAAPVVRRQDLIGDGRHAAPPRVRGVRKPS